MFAGPQIYSPHSPHSFIPRQMPLNPLSLMPGQYPASYPEPRTLSSPILGLHPLSTDKSPANSLASQYLHFGSPEYYSNVSYPVGWYGGQSSALSSSMYPPNPLMSTSNQVFNNSLHQQLFPREEDTAHSHQLNRSTERKRSLIQNSQPAVDSRDDHVVNSPVAEESRAHRRKSKSEKSKRNSVSSGTQTEESSAICVEQLIKPVEDYRSATDKSTVIGNTAMLSESAFTVEGLRGSPESKSSSKQTESSDAQDSALSVEACRPLTAFKQLVLSLKREDKEFMTRSSFIVLCGCSWNGNKLVGEHITRTLLTTKSAAQSLTDTLNQIAMAIRHESLRERNPQTPLSPTLTSGGQNTIGNLRQLSLQSKSIDGFISIRSLIQLCDNMNILSNYDMSGRSLQSEKSRATQIEIGTTF
jgi:hypothetical protein